MQETKESRMRRFMSKVEPCPTTGCWLWTGSVNHKGYGWFCDSRKDGGRARKAHRIAYEELVGPIPEGLTIDHICNVPGCVNPEHLRPLTMRENIMRGNGACARNARKTHCPQGHEYTPENTETYRGGRYCRQCRKEGRHRGKRT